VTRFVKIFRYDPEKDPRARIRIDYDPDFGNAILSDENVHVEQAENPDPNHTDVLASMQLTAPMVRWIATQMAELATIMEADVKRIQDELDREKLGKTE
jgi:hypothetical protein